MALDKINPHPRDAHISFDEPTHTYTIDGDSNYKSVTTFIHDFFPHFNADIAIKKMCASPKWNNTNKLYGKTPEEIKEIWRKNGEAASTQGTAMHLNIENYYNGEPMTESFRTSKEGELFQKYLQDHKAYKAYRSEWTVYSKKYRIAGSIDMVYEDPNNPGCHVIADWKRSVEIKFENRWEKGNGPLSHLDNCNYWHYTLQLNIYRMLLEKYYDKRITEMFLVILHPNQENYLKIEIPKISKEILDMLEYRKLAIQSIV